MKYLVIDACTRDNSRTRRLYLEYIKDKKDVKIVKLYDTDIKPIDNEAIHKRDLAKLNHDFSDHIFDYGKDFINADEIIIAAPYWDLSFPSILKIYFENISVGGLTFGYDNHGKIIGFGKASRLIYFSTCGGKIDRHMGYEYVSEISKSFFGVKETYNYCIDSLDIDPSKTEELLDKGIKEIMKNIESL